MKKLLLFVFLFTALTQINAQKVTVGIENGINFSNIHQSNGTTQIDGLSGPVNGIFFKFEPLSWMVIQSGINHTSSYFYQKNYQNYPDYYPDYSPSEQLIRILPPSYNFENQNFNFLRIPLLLKLKSTGRLSGEFGGGFYYAIITNDKFRGKDREIRNSDFIETNFPPLNDWGTILAGSLNYQIDKHWSVFAAGQVTNAKSFFLKDIGGKIGSSELTFGIGYSPISITENFQKEDSVTSKLVLLPHSGVLYSAVKASTNDKYYQGKLSFSAGISAKFLLNQTVSFVSGVWFERKGYQLDYPGTNTFVYLRQSDSESQILYELSSNVDLDYLTFPVLIDFSAGRNLKSHFNAGLYFSWLQNAGCQGEILEAYNYENGYNITNHFFKNDLDKWIKNYDAGVLFGYRLEWQAFKNGGLFLGLNQSIGVVNLFENLENVQDVTNSLEKLKIFNRSTTIAAGVNIPLSK